MSFRPLFPHWRTHRPTHFPTPILRLTVTALTVLLFLTAIRKLSSSGLPPPSASSDRIEYRRPLLKYSLPLPLPAQDHLVSPVHLARPEPPSESRIGKVTILLDATDPTLLRALRTHEVHNRKHGYPLLMLRHGLVDGGAGLDAAWNKPAYILAVLLEEMRKEPGERLEWLFWHDADTILVNPTIPLSVFLPRAAHTHLLLTRGPHGLDSGVLFLRVHPWSIAFFTAVLACSLLNPLHPLPRGDESALDLVLSLPRLCNHYTEVPHRWFNARSAELEDGITPDAQARQGDLLVHFAHCPVEEREERTRVWFERSEGLLKAGEWAVPFETSMLKGDLAIFWEGREREQDGKNKEVQGLKEVAGAMAHVTSGWVTEFGEWNGERGSKIAEEAILRAQSAIEDENIDAEELRAAIDNLMEASQPFRALVEESKAMLDRDARAVIAEADTTLLTYSEDWDSQFAQTIQSALAKLKEVLAREPDDRAMIRVSIVELSKATRGLP